MFGFSRGYSEANKQVAQKQTPGNEANKMLTQWKCHNITVSNPFRTLQGFRGRGREGRGGGGRVVNTLPQ